MQRRAARLRAWLWVLALALVGGAALVGGGAEQAWAQGAQTTHKVAVLNVIGEGVSGDLPQEVTQVIKQQTRRNPSFELVLQEDIALLESLLLLGCEEPTDACMTQLAEELKTDRLIYGRLRSVNGLYDIKITIFDRKKQTSVQVWNKRFTANADVIGFFRKEMEQFLGGKAPFKPITLRVSSNLEGAYVLVDGRRVGKTPFITRDLKPGNHRIEVQRTGYVPWSSAMLFQEGAQMNLRAELRPDPAAAARVGPVAAVPKLPVQPDPNAGGPPPVRETTKAQLKLETFGWVLTGVGAASMVAGGVMGVLMLNTKAEFDDTPYYNEALELKERGESQALASNILLGAGGGAVLLGVILVAVDAGSESAPRAASGAGDDVERARGWGGLEVKPAVGGDAAGVLLEGAW